MNDFTVILQGIAAALRLGGPPSIGCHKANIDGLVAVWLGPTNLYRLRTTRAAVLPPTDP